MARTFQYNTYLFRELGIEARARLTHERHLERVKGWEGRAAKEAVARKYGFTHPRTYTYRRGTLFEGFIPLGLVDLERPKDWRFDDYNHSRTTIAISIQEPEYRAPYITMKIDTPAFCSATLLQYVGENKERILLYTYNLIWKVIQEMDTLPELSLEATYEELMKDVREYYLEDGNKPPWLAGSKKVEKETED